MRVIILCLLFLIPTAIAADKGIFYILDEKFIDNISELPESTNITPDKIIQGTDGSLAGWIDIVGFRNMTHEDGGDYVLGNPVDNAIVQGDAGILEYGQIVEISKANTHGEIYDSLTKTISVKQEGNRTNAKLHAVLKWHSCSANGGCSSGQEARDFIDTEIAPQRYPEIKENLTADITQYNNSLYENIGIRIVNISGLNKYTIQYENNVATYHIKKAHVEKTAKGVYFANVTPAEFLELNGKNISRYGKMILLNGNLSKMSHDDLKITGSNLYETKTANSNQFNITRLEFKPEKELENPVMMWFMSVVAVMVGGIYFYARRMSALW